MSSPPASRGDSLGDRMKRHEASTKRVFPPQTPVIIRVDGKAFHTYTRGLEKPYCLMLQLAMDTATRVLCEEIQGAQLAYVQSDEISVLLVGHKKFVSNPWFDNKQSKMETVAASMAGSTVTANSGLVFDGKIKPAFFDARAFPLPDHEVPNYFLWRQQDAVRNSIQMVARALYSHRECNNKNVDELREMCTRAGQSWETFDHHFRFGRTFTRQPSPAKLDDGQIVIRKLWKRMDETPDFKSNREFFDPLLDHE